MRSTAGRRAGLAALELALALAIVGAGFAALVLVGSGLPGTPRRATTRAELDRRAHQVLGRLVEALEHAGAEGLEPRTAAPFSSAFVLFRRPVDFAGRAVLWSPLERLGWERDPAELPNGEDDDGDGLVDEGALLWTEDPGGPSERREVWADGVAALHEGEARNGRDDDGNGLVDEPGLAFCLEGDVLRVLLTLEARDASGRTSTRSAEAAVRLRNP